MNNSPNNHSGSSERSLIDNAWAQVEVLTKVGKPVRSNDSGTFGTLPGYRILSEIHRGGQGIVYQAIQESTNRKIAIKVLREGPFADQTEMARFEREVDILSRLTHPNIVAIHDRGFAAGHAYFVMDYIAGEPLDAHVASAKLSIDETLALFAKVCEAVNVAHLRGVIHRDLKPGNIRVDLEGQPRILDFGLAKFVQEVSLNSSEQNMTMTGQFVGSLPWASPEQACGHSELIDIRTDVYSLGVILYHMLTGRFPYPVTGSIRDVQEGILNATPVTPSAIAKHIDTDLETIALKCLAKQPERRYQSAGELARDIRHYVAGEPIEARRDSMLYVLRKQLRKHRGSAAVAVMFAFMIVGGLIYCAAQWQRANNEAIRAVKAERDALARAEELEQVAGFQEAQLSGVNAHMMGVRLREDLLERARLVSERSNLSPEDARAREEELEMLIAGSDFTGLALETLDANVFRPALLAVEKEFADHPPLKARLLQTLSDTMSKVGLYAAATPAQEEALAIRRRVLGDEHPDTLLAMNQLFCLLDAQGKLAEGEPYVREALEKSRRALGVEHPVTLSSMSNFGALLNAQGKYDEAEQYHSEALEARRRVLGNEHPDTLRSVNSLGVLYKDRGKLAQAEPYFREAIETRRRVLGNEHIDTLNALTNLGTLFQDQGKFSEAEQCYREALDLHHRVLGDDYPRTARTRFLVGTALYLQGKLTEAEPFYREALATQRRIQGVEHPETLSSITNMGILLKSQGKLTEAETYYREGLETGRRVLGEEHPHTVTALTNLGVLLQSQGKLSEAEPYYREGLEKLRRVRGDEHPHTFSAMNNLGSLLFAQGKLADAEPYFREALEKRRRVLGEAHRDTLISVNNLGALLKAQGKLTEAEPYMREALDKCRQSLGAEHANTVMSIHNMGGLLQAQGKSPEAVELLAPAEALARKTFVGGNSVRLVRFLTVLGCARVATRDFEAAEANLTEAFALLDKAPGATGKDRTELLSGLVELYEKWQAAEPERIPDDKITRWRRESDEATDTSAD